MTLAADHVDENFPKGETNMRGEAIVLVAQILVDLIAHGAIEVDE